MSVWRTEDGRIHVGVEYKGRRSPHVTTTQDGKRIKTEKEARQIEAKLLKQLTDEVNKGIFPDVLLADALRRYVRSLRPESQTKEGHKVDYLIEHWAKGRMLTEILDVYDDLVAESTERGYAIATINRRISILRRVAKLAFADRLWHKPSDSELSVEQWPVMRLYEPTYMSIKELPGGFNPRLVRMSLSEALALIAACDTDQIRDFVTIALYTGSRISGLLKIGREYRIDWEQRAILIPVRGQKNRKHGVFPIIEKTPQIQLPAMDEALRRSFPLTFKETYFRYRLQAAAKAIGRPDITPHALRRTFGCLQLEAGVDIGIVSKLLNHSNLQMTLAYYIDIARPIMAQAISRGLSSPDAPPTPPAAPQSAPPHLRIIK